jgi:hypothetical protein
MLRTGAACPSESDHDVAMTASEGQFGQQRDPYATGDKGLTGRYLVHLERDLGLEAGRAASAQDDVVARSDGRRAPRQIAGGGIDE